MSQLRAMQTEAVDRGTLQINVTSSVNAFPVERAEISISYTGVPAIPDIFTVMNARQIHQDRRRQSNLQHHRRSGVWI